MSRLDQMGQEACAALTNFAINIANWKENLQPESVPATDLAQALFNLKTLYEDIDAQRKVVYNVLDALNKGILPEKLDHMGVDLIRVPEVARSFSIRLHNSASILDKAVAFEWLREVGQGDVIIETVNAQTLASVCKTMLIEQGIEPPEEAIKTSTYRSISINKYTPK